MNRKVRVRFAPSPTGPLHIGGVRTALYNYLFARKHGGDFILRIENTDQLRYVPGAEEYIIESLNWCGIAPNEGVVTGGPFAPYRQSERLPEYRKYADALLKEGHAYYAFDTPEALEKARKEYESRKETFQYGPATRSGMINSLTLKAEELQEKLRNGEPYVVRILIPEKETIVFQDLIREEVSFDSSLLDDKVLFKSDGFPTYHLANVVDDYLMRISHVIRGEEWLPSAPLHVLLYRYLGWEHEMPAFAHLPLLLKPEGTGKLSKRDGDRLGFPVFPLKWTDPVTGEVSSGYRESGYLPEAFINMLALLGWNPGTEQEIFSLEELVEAFSLDRVGKSGSRFDPEKARWFNHQYLMELPGESLAALAVPYLAAHDVQTEPGYVQKVCSLMKERIVLLTDFWEKTWYFFTAPAEYDPKTVKEKWKPNTPALLEELTARWDLAESFEAQEIESVLRQFLEAKGLGMGLVMNAIRLALTGSNTGPGVTDLLVILGKAESLGRIRAAIRNIHTS